MKALSGIALTSLILTLLIVYLLQPLNTGAIAIVALICISLTTIVYKGLQSLLKKRKGV